MQGDAVRQVSLPPRATPNAGKRENGSWLTTSPAAPVRSLGLAPTMGEMAKMLASFESLIGPAQPGPDSLA